MVAAAAESRKKKTATLVLEDGTSFQGWVFGSETSVAGEVGEELGDFTWFHVDI